MIPPLTLTAVYNIKTNCEAVLPLYSTSALCYACYCSAQLGICEKAWGKYNQHKLIVLPSVSLLPEGSSPSTPTLSSPGWRGVLPS